jgi:hypothetical protein
MTLEGKRAIVIAPKFFNYEKEITKELKALGVEVIFFYDNLYGNFNDIIRAIAPPVFSSMISGYQRRIIALAKKEQSIHPIDFFFVIKGVIQNENFLLEMRAVLPDTKFIMYQWDSLRNYQFAQFVRHYDHVYSFDREDSLKLENVTYLPLFFLKKYQIERSQPPEIDISFCASYSKERSKILEQIIASYEGKLNLKFLLYMKRLSLLKYLVKNKRYPLYYTLKKMNSDQLADIMKRSKAVIDIHSPAQSGLTIRTLEVLAAGCKLITTNDMIQEEDFYNEEQITVINRNDAVLKTEFINAPFDHTIKPGLMACRIDNWMKRIFLDESYSNK